MATAILYCNGRLLGMTSSKFMSREISKPRKSKWSNVKNYVEVLGFEGLPNLHFSININKHYIDGEIRDIIIQYKNGRPLGMTVLKFTPRENTKDEILNGKSRNL